MNHCIGSINYEIRLATSSSNLQFLQIESNKNDLNAVMKTPWLIQTVWGNNEQGKIIPSGSSQHYQNTSSFVSGLKPVVNIGRLFGVLSRSDILSKQEGQRRITFPAIYSGSLAVFFFVNAILFTRAYFLTFKTKPSTSDKLAELSTVGYVLTMFFLYTYLLFATKRFRSIVQYFTAQGQGEKPSQLSVFPATFPKFCWIITIVCLMFGVGENIFYDVQNLTKGGKVNSTLQLYYKQNFNHWSEIFPYHPVLTVILVIIVKCGTWGWVYGDVIPIVLTKALTEKLRMLDQEIHEKIVTQSLLQNKTKASGNEEFRKTWDAVQDEFMMLSKVASEIQKFIAPLIMTCYGVNVYIIMINLFLWIAPHATITLEQSHYVYFAFLNFLFRVSSVTYFAAEVQHTSSSILTTIQRCPNSLYTLSLERIEQNLISNPIGIRLFGSFLITRKSFISIISCLFSTEIVLLQTVKD